MKKYFCLLIIFLLPVLISGFTILNADIIDETNNPVCVIGVNVPYLTFLSNNEIESALNKISKSGIKLVRFFASARGNTHYAFEKMLGVYNESMFSKVDFILQKSQNLNLKVIITLMDNNKTYGGKEVFKDWLGGNHEDIFFKDKISKEYFKKYLLKFIMRYKNNQTIFAWDLCNEIEDNHDEDGKILYNWINEIAKFIKINDKQRLVTVNIKKMSTSNEIINTYDIFLNPNIDLVFYNIFLTPNTNLESVAKSIINYNKQFFMNVNKPVLLCFGDLTDNKLNSISYISDIFFKNYGNVLIYNYGGFGVYSNYKGAYNFNDNNLTNSFINTSKGTSCKKMPIITVKNISVKPDQQSAIINFEINQSANTEIYYDENFPLKNKTKTIGVSKDNSEIVLNGLNPESSYLFIIKTTSANFTGISKVQTFQTLKLTRKKTVPFKRSNNFITVKGTKFYDGNREYKYLGTSNYYLRNAGKDTINYILSEAAKIGFKVIRVGSNAEAESFDKVDKKNLNRFFRIGKDYFNEDAYKELDYVLAAAEKYGLRVILHFTDNWEYYGGIKVIAGWSGVSKNDFWTDENAKKYYKQSIVKIANRKNTVNGKLYKNDPTIFAYDLCNEPRDEADQSSQTLAQWIDEMSTYVKSVDPNHLVTTGLEGFFLKDDGTHYSWADYILCHKPKNIDFCTFHIYPTYSHNHFSLSTTEWLIKKWINDGHNIICKPVVMEEYGIGKNDKEYPKAKWISEMTKIFFENGGNGANYWFLTDENYAYGDGFEVRLSETIYINEFIRWANLINRNGY